MPQAIPSSFAPSSRAVLAVNLLAMVGLRGPAGIRTMNFSSPPTVCRNVVIVGSGISDGPTRLEMPTGDVRGYDVRTGKELWSFHTVPRKGEFGSDSWEGEANEYSGNSNVWSMISADEPLGFAYLPTGTPTNDWYGGHRLGDNLIDFTPELRAEAVEILRRFEHGPLFTPPSLKGTVQLPGWSGGASWGGAAFDPALDVLFVGSHTDPIVVAVGEPDRSRSQFRYSRAAPTDIEGPDGLPLFKPPYSRLTAIDLKRGEILWSTPFGDGPVDHPRLAGLGLENLGSGGRMYVMVTKALVFANSDARTHRFGPEQPFLRAYDKRTGELVATVELPSVPNGAPMGYVKNGRQFLVLQFGGRGEPAELVALSLPAKTSS